MLETKNLYLKNKRKFNFTAMLSGTFIRVKFNFTTKSDDWSKETFVSCSERSMTALVSTIL